MTDWSLLALVVSFLLLPGTLAFNSWRKLQRISLEWIVFGLWAMSIYIAAAESWMLSSMSELIGKLLFPKEINSFVNSGWQILAIFLGPLGFYIAWDEIEESAISEPQNWRKLRSLCWYCCF